jgi:hypothetical protein
LASTGWTELVLSAFGTKELRLRLVLKKRLKDSKSSRKSKEDKVSGGNCSLTLEAKGSLGIAARCLQPGVLSLQQGPGEEGGKVGSDFYPSWINLHANTAGSLFTLTNVTQNLPHAV